MDKIKIKPLSVNDAWKGRRFKTDEYKRYIKDVFFLLPAKEKVRLYDKIHLSIKCGFSSSLSDVDNPLKPFIDILQKKYGFNDNRIFLLDIEKEIVNKGEEYISFEVSEYKEYKDREDISKRKRAL